MPALYGIMCSRASYLTELRVSTCGSLSTLRRTLRRTRLRAVYFACWLFRRWASGSSLLPDVWWGSRLGGSMFDGSQLDGSALGDEQLEAPQPNGSRLDALAHDGPRLDDLALDGSLLDGSRAVKHPSTQ